MLNKKKNSFTTILTTTMLAALTLALVSPAIFNSDIGCLVPSRLLRTCSPLIPPQLLMSVILANVIVLAMDHKDISDEELMALERANLVFTFVFGLEMVRSRFGIGFLHFSMDTKHSQDY